MLSTGTTTGSRAVSSIPGSAQALRHLSNYLKQNLSFRSCRDAPKGSTKNLHTSRDKSCSCCLAYAHHFRAVPTLLVAQRSQHGSIWLVLNSRGSCSFYKKVTPFGPHLSLQSRHNEKPRSFPISAFAMLSQFSLADNIKLCYQYLNI